MATVVPTLAARLERHEGRRPDDPMAARFELFRALDRFWDRASAGGTLLLIIEDVHWADTGSLLMMGQMASTLPRRPIVVLATMRTGEVTSGDRRSDGLGELTSRASLIVPVPGLAVEEVAELVDRAEIGAEPGLVEALVARTGGNPLFVTELLRLLSAGSDSDHYRVAVNEVPRHVADVVARRVARLPAAVARLLQTAAVLGPEGDVSVLAIASELETDATLALLDDALVAGVLSPTDASRWKFAHALVRDAVYHSLPARVRRQMHARALAALERNAVSPPAGELARHAIEALPLVAPTRAAMFSARAGRVAMAQLAYESAASHFSYALRAIESVSSEDADSAVRGHVRSHLHVRLPPRHGRSARCGPARP